MMMITNIDSYIQTVTNVSALLQNKDFLENLHPRYTEVLARCSANNASASPASPSAAAAPLDAAIQTLLETGVQPETAPVNKHSIGIVGLLCAKTRTQDFNTNFENFLVQASGFMEVADWGQLRLVAGVVTEIATAITDQMIRRTQPILGINLLGTMAKALQAHDKMLTCVHSCVLQLCCASYNFKAGLAYIVDDFEEFTGDLKGSDNTHYLLTYLYYSGLIHTALKQHDKAIYFYEACTRVPAITLSHIMLEAYKKYVLVTLIHLGEVPPPHKSSAQVVNRVLKPSAVPYTELATSFAIGSDSLSNCVAKNLECYRRDGNLGLVKQVKSAHMRVLIRKLTRTFLTLGLEDVGRRANVGGGGGGGVGEFVVGEAERVVLGMIEEGSVFAKINQKDGNVLFLDEVGNNSSSSGGGGGGNVSNHILDLIEGKLNSCIELNRRVNTMNERISTNPEFFSKVVVSLDSGSSGGGGSNAAGSSSSLHNNDVIPDQSVGSSSSSSLISSTGGGGGAAASRGAGGSGSSGRGGGAGSSSNVSNSNL